MAHITFFTSHCPFQLTQQNIRDARLFFIMIRTEIIKKKEKEKKKEKFTEIIPQTLCSIKY